MSRRMASSSYPRASMSASLRCAYAAMSVIAIDVLVDPQARVWALVRTRSECGRPVEIDGTTAARRRTTRLVLPTPCVNAVCQHDYQAKGGKVGGSGPTRPPRSRGQRCLINLLGKR